MILIGLSKASLKDKCRIASDMRMPGSEILSDSLLCILFDSAAFYLLS